MTKKQKIGVATGLGVILLLIGGLWLWRGNSQLSVSGLENSSRATGAFSQALTPTSGQAIPLNQTKPSSEDSSGLSVSSSREANRLGQIGGSQGSSTSSSSSGGGSSSGLPDPSTFKEYEKYKDGTSSLFGEIKVGDGPEIATNKKAAVFYKGWLTNGQLFDETRTGSDGKMQPFVFTQGAHQVIPGWEQGVAGMKVGGTRLIIVPPSVGYGAQGQGTIPGNSVLVFIVQLVATE